MTSFGVARCPLQSSSVSVRLVAGSSSPFFKGQVVAPRVSPSSTTAGQSVRALIPRHCRELVKLEYTYTYSPKDNNKAIRTYH